MVEQILVFVFGSIVGSFLNVCIHRLPLEESIVKPGSHCCHCNKQILWYDNVPLLSYLLLGGKCRFCKKKISLRYFFVELLTAGMFLLFFRLYGLSYTFISYSIFASGLIIATFVDIKHRIIPDEISLGGIAVGVAVNLVRPYIEHGSYDLLPVFDSLLGVLIGGGIIYFTGFLFDLIYFKVLKRPPIQGETESMGGGDVKLLAMIGAFLGWKRALLTFFIAPFLGVVIGIVNLVSKKDHTIPYGPFLSLGALISLFWMDKIISLLFFAG